MGGESEQIARFPADKTAMSKRRVSVVQWPPDFLLLKIEGIGPVIRFDWPQVLHGNCV